jgi:hypothetical protein
MSDELVKRARDAAIHLPLSRTLIGQLADRIEALTVENERLRRRIADDMQESLDMQSDHRDMLALVTSQRDALTEKLAMAVEALDPYEILAKHHAADAPEWGPFDSVTAQVSIMHLRNVTIVLAAIKEGGE